MTAQRHPTLTATSLIAVPRARRRTARTSTVRDFNSCARALARWYVEYRSGRRHADQMYPLLSPEVRDALRSTPTHEMWDPGTAPVVTSLIQHTSTRSVSAVVLVSQGRRLSAVTIAFDRDDDHTPWRVTELTTPEDRQHLDGELDLDEPVARRRTA